MCLKQPQHTADIVTAESTTATSYPRSSLKGDVNDCQVSAISENITGREHQKMHGISLELISHIDRKNFDSGHLKTFSEIVVMPYSTWVSGWSRNYLSKNDTVVLNVSGPEYTVQMKKKKRDENAGQPTLMVSYRDHVLFAKKGSQLFNFNTHSRDFKPVRSNLSIVCLCCSDNYVYILNQTNLKYIRILNFEFNASGNIPSFIENEKNFDFDMCLFPEIEGSFQPRTTNHGLILC